MLLESTHFELWCVYSYVHILVANYLGTSNLELFGSRGVCFISEAPISNDFLAPSPLDHRMVPMIAWISRMLPFDICNSPSMWMNKSFATFLFLKSVSSSLNAVRISAHSWATTARSSAAVLHARTDRMSSRSFIDIIVSGCASKGTADVDGDATQDWREPPYSRYFWGAAERTKKGWLESQLPKHVCRNSTRMRLIT